MPTQNMTRPELMLALHRTMYGHNSSFVQLDDGRLLQVCLGGALCHSEDGGLTWTEPGGQEVSSRGPWTQRCTHRAADADVAGLVRAAAGAKAL